MGPNPLQKSKAFIKNAINWYQKKTHRRLKKEAKRVKGRERGKDQNLPPLGKGISARKEGVGKVGTVIQSA